MNRLNRKEISTQKLVTASVLMALVVIMQMLAQSIVLGPFNVSLVLIPIVIGAALCGTGIGTALGFVSGIVILLTGQAAAFLTVDPFGTIVTVLLKGALSGLAAGVVYKLLEKKNRYVAVVAAAIACPVANTGIFILGCLVFFLDTVAAWGEAVGYSSTFSYIFLGLVGGNFIFELLTDLILSPVVVRILDIRSKSSSKA